MYLRTCVFASEVVTTTSSSTPSDTHVAYGDLVSRVAAMYGTCTLNWRLCGFNFYSGQLSFFTCATTVPCVLAQSTCAHVHVHMYMYMYIP